MCLFSTGGRLASAFTGWGMPLGLNRPPCLRAPSPDCGSRVRVGVGARQRSLRCCIPDQACRSESTASISSITATLPACTSCMGVGGWDSDRYQAGDQCPAKAGFDPGQHLDHFAQALLGLGALHPVTPHQRIAGKVDSAGDLFLGPAQSLGVRAGAKRPPSANVVMCMACSTSCDALVRH